MPLANKNELLSSMSIILHRMLGRTVRMEGLCALMKENCKACSSYPDQVEPIKAELDRIVMTVSQLIDAFDKEVNK